MTDEAPPPVPAPAPSAAVPPEGDKPVVPAPAPEGVDKQLVALAVGLWLLAMVVIGMKWTRMRVDWYLGNLHKARIATEQDDPVASARLVELAEDDPAALALLRDEILGSPRQRANEDAFFRGAVARAVARVRGIAAANVLHETCVVDPHPYVRTQAYDGLAGRAKLYREDERDGAIKAGLRALSIPGEPDVLTRAHAAALLGTLEAGPDAVWPVLRAYRDSRTSASATELEQVRALQSRGMEGEALALLLGDAAKDLPRLDPAADQAARDVQVRAWESYWSGKGHEIPKGERLDEVYAGSIAAPGSATTAPAGSQTPTSPVGPPNPSSHPSEGR